jgi:hypothetical protein
MNCRECSKVIPDGFTDCPWCGAVQGKAAAVSARGTVSTDSAASPGHDFLIAMSVLSSAILFMALNYFAMVRDEGSLTLANSAYFLGRCAGSIILAAILVFLYFKIRGKKRRSAIQLLMIFSLSSLLTLLAMASPARHRPATFDPATLRHYGDMLKSSDGSISTPAAQTKWDPAVRSWLKDIISRNQQYVSEISKLDETAQPLYTPESFRDSATDQQIIDQLHARLAVADKYADWEPVFAKMKDYVAAVDASEKEKREFMAGYVSTLPAARASHKALADKEHAWLLTSLDLYQFALAKEGNYVFQGGNLIFKQRGDSNIFNQKLSKARNLNAEFLRAYWDSRHRQQAMLAQMGLQGTEFDLNLPR